MAKYLLHNFMIDEHIKNALKEDIGFGDISTDFLVTNKDLKTLYLNAREDGVLCGIDVFKRVFKGVGFLNFSTDIIITTSKRNKRE